MIIIRTIVIITTIAIVITVHYYEHNNINTRQNTPPPIKAKGLDAIDLELPVALLQNRVRSLRAWCFRAFGVLGLGFRV